MSSDQIDSIIGRVLTEVSACVSQVSGESLAQAGTLMAAAPRIFLAGAGRSGLCMRAFGMRLMHLGKIVYVVGETITPSIAAEDLLILGSGSGQTANLRLMAEQARRQGAKSLLFTAEMKSPLADLADHRVIIPVPSLRLAEGLNGLTSVQPMGTLFEQSLLILGDSLILGLMPQSGVGVEQMRKRHANLE